MRDEVNDRPAHKVEAFERQRVAELPSVTIIGFTVSNGGLRATADRQLRERTGCSGALTFSPPPRALALFSAATQTKESTGGVIPFATLKNGVLYQE